MISALHDQRIHLGKQLAHQRKNVAGVLQIDDFLGRAHLILMRIVLADLLQFKILVRRPLKDDDSLLARHTVLSNDRINDLLHVEREKSRNKLLPQELAVLIVLVIDWLPGICTVFEFLEFDFFCVGVTNYFNRRHVSYPCLKTINITVFGTCMWSSDVLSLCMVDCPFRTILV